MGFSAEDISKATGLSTEDIEKFNPSHKMLRILLLWLMACPAMAQGFQLRKEHDSLYWLNGWRLPYPVYQFQTGDVDGDGHIDAMVGVVKPTRFYPEKGRRLFIFKQVNGKARPLWLGSKLGGILQDFRFIDGRIRSLETARTTVPPHHRTTVPPHPCTTVPPPPRTTDTIYVVAEYKWGGFGMAFDHYIIKGTDKETATKYFSQ